MSGPHSTVNRGRSSIPTRILSIYIAGESLRSSIKIGKIRFIADANLYSTLEELFKKAVEIMYPDYIFAYLNANYINKFAKDYPELVGNISPSNLVDYQTFDINGYEVQVLNDIRAMKMTPSIMRTKGTEGLYYWNIPELQTRSLDNKKDIDRQPWETGRFPTVQLALNSAEKYINHLFYSENS